MSIEQALRQHDWNRSVGLEQIPKDIPSMILWEEQRLLHWLAREWYQGEGAIVDLGCFVGSSTLSFISGLEARPPERRIRCRPVIHSYDMFITPDDPYTFERLPPGRRKGDSFRDVFDGNLGAHASWVDVHAGDLRKLGWGNGPIALCFLDICKCWSTNQAVFEHFFPHLIPGRSIVIQQDFNHPWSPWIPIGMQWLAPWFEIIGEEASSRIYLLKERIPWERLNTQLRIELSLAQKIELLEASIAGSPPRTAAHHTAALAIQEWMEGDVQRARQTLEAAQAAHGADAEIAALYGQVRDTMDCWKVGSAYEADMDQKF